MPTTRRKSALEATLALLVKDVTRGRCRTRKPLRWLVRLCKEEPNLVVHLAGELLDKYDGDDKETSLVSGKLISGLIDHFPAATPDIASKVWEKCSSSSSPQVTALKGSLWAFSHPAEVAELTRKAIREWKSGVSQAGEAAKSTLEALIRGCKCGDEVAGVLLQESNRCSKDMLAELQTKLVQLAPSCSNKAEDIYEALLNACSDRNAEVQRAAVSRLVAMLRVWPHHAAEIAQTLTEACAQGDYDARATALCQIVDAIRMCPDHAEEFVLQLVKASESHATVVFSTALCRLPKAAQECPSQSSALYNAFKAAFACSRTFDRLSSRSGVTDPKVEWFKDAFVAWPGHANELATLVVSQAIHSGVDSIIVEGLKSIPTALEANPDTSGHLIRTLLNAYEHGSIGHESKEIQEAALAQFAACLKSKACKYEAGTLISALLAACHPSQPYKIRRTATRQLAEAAKVNPSLAKAVWDVLKRRFDQGDSAAAVASIATLVEVFREHSVKLVTVLFEECCNLDKQVRIDAMRQLVPTALLIPEWADWLITALFRGCLDGDLEVQMEAASRLGKAAEAFPSMKGDLLRALDWCIGGIHEHVRAVAVEQITPIMRALPDLAIETMAKVERERIKVKAPQNEATTKAERKKIIMNLVNNPVPEDVNVFSGQKRRRSESPCWEEESPRGKRKHDADACVLRRTCSEGGSPAPDDRFY